MKLKELVKEYLENNLDEVIGIVSNLDSYDGSFEDLRAEENEEDFFNTYFEGKPMELVRAISYGKYNYNDKYVRFNGYGNLETLCACEYEAELLDELDRIVDSMLENLTEVWISSELQDIIDDYEDNEYEEEE